MDGADNPPPNANGSAPGGGDSISDHFYGYSPLISDFGWNNFHSTSTTNSAFPGACFDADYLLPGGRRTAGSTSSLCAAPLQSSDSATDLVKIQGAAPTTSSSQSAFSSSSEDPPEKSTASGDVAAETSTKGKKKVQKRIRQPLFAFVTKSDVDNLEDGYRWRKYGQKAVKNSPFPRSYYRCTNSKCTVKKRVERSSEDPTVVITTYEGRHCHHTVGFPRGGGGGYINNYQNAFSTQFVHPAATSASQLFYPIPREGSVSVTQSPHHLFPAHGQEAANKEQPSLVSFPDQSSAEQVDQMDEGLLADIVSPRTRNH